MDETSEGPQPFIESAPVKKESLCSKYDIPVSKLSFEYVPKCTNVKELERIVKILRSGEEGDYPELQKVFEQHLQILSPNSRLLRYEEAVVRRESMMPEDRNLVDNDLKQWVDDMSSKDEELTDWNKNYSAESGSGDYIPPVRRGIPKKSDNSKHQNAKNIKKPVVSDYASWDKYDADTELLKIDAGEERKKMEKEIELRKKKAAAEANNKKEEHSRLICLINSAKNMLDAERSFHAIQEKDRGNEYYKASNYDDAIDYYTASIAISPNPVAYSNRAASYLKQGKYDLALSDANKCLELDPEYTKGLYRRGLCLQHKNKFDEAFRDMQAVLRKEPHNLVVQHVAKELRQQCHSVPRSVRLLVEEEECNKIVELSETEAQMKAGFEVNEWGLARNICSCYGRSHFMFTRGTEIADHLVYVPEEKKKIIPEKEIPIHEKEPENLTNCSPVANIACNDAEEAMETNRVCFSRNADDEADETIPLKIKIIETVKPSKNCVVKDMRGQKHVQGEKESDMTEQFNNISIDESIVSSASIIENSNRELNVKQNQNVNNNNIENNERNCLSNQNKKSVPPNNEIDVPSEKQPITVACKYTKKTTSAKNLNAQNDSCSINSNSNKTSSDTSSKESVLTPYKFSTLWSSIKNAMNYKEYASILRKVPPSELHTVLANKLEEAMLLKILQTLANEFDATKWDEADLIKQYLVSLSEVERFTIIVQFLKPEIKKLTSCLIEKVGGNDTSRLKKSYMV